MDLVATVQGGWWMGEDLCIATGFILTVLGIVKEDSEQMAPSYLLTHEHQANACFVQLYQFSISKSM